MILSCHDSVSLGCGWPRCAIFRLQAVSIHSASLIFIVLARALCFAASAAQVVDLHQAFVHPPDYARPWVNWFWLDGNITRQGITADLEAMQRVGIGGVLLMDVSQDIPPGPIRFGSRQWRELFQHTLEEAQRLGLEVSINNGPGWCGSGGPWITPELAMQKLVWSQTNLAGPARFDGLLRALPKANGFCRDIATLAFPTPQGPRVAVPDLAPKTGLSRNFTSSVRPYDVLRRATILDLTSRTDGEGRLRWDVPQGQWTVLRFGYTPTGRETHPTAVEGRGLECDKLSKAAVEAHFAGMLATLIADAGSGARRALTQTHIDSWEVGFQNWTPRFREEFQQRRAYDPLLYLPTFSGRIVESPEISERFLWDMRRTIADLVADNYAGHLAELAHEHGQKLSIEAYGNGPFDDLQYAARADVPMGEFWTEADSAGRFNVCKSMASAAHTYGKPLLATEAFTSYPATAKWQNHPFSLKAMADAAFCEGVNRLVIHRYAHQPWLDRKPGMTMGPFGVHYERTQTWWEQSKSWHEYLARCQFLLQQGLFVADICYMTQEGAYAEPPGPDKLRPPPPAGYDYDLATPEVVRTRMSVKDGRLALPDGMNYRVLVLPDTQLLTPALLRKVKQLAEAGATIIGSRPSKSPGLTDYPECDSEVEQLAGELWGDCDGKAIKEHAVGKGKIIAGKSLDTVLTALRAPADFEQLTKTTGYKLRCIHRKIDGAEFYFVANSNSQPVIAECAFGVAAKQPELWHPDTGRIENPAIWHEQDGRTVVPLKFDSCGSIFVVFDKASSGANPVITVTRDGNVDSSAEISFGPNGKLELLVSEPGIYGLKTASGKSVKVEIKDLPKPVQVTGKWELRFPPNSGAPERITLDKLISWPDHSDPGVKYFSGAATYGKTIQIPPEWIAGHRRLYLDLGKVQVIAEVKLNGQSLGTLWKPPFRADITDVARAGENQLEVQVVNLWPNRLVGDEQLPDDCQWRTPQTEMGMPLAGWPKWLLEDKPSPTGRLTFTTWKHWTKNSPLLESGLLGPVTLRVLERIAVQRP